MLTQLRHCNVRIAAERVLLLLYTVNNAHVIARVSLLERPQPPGDRKPRGWFCHYLTPDGQTHAHAERKSSSLQGEKDLQFVSLGCLIRQ